MSDGIWKDVAEMNAMSQKAEIKPKPGERWRVTLEGRITSGGHQYPRIEIDGFGDDWSIPWRAGTWERLPDPEPEWQPGDLVIDADGQVWKRFAPVHIHGCDYVWNYPDKRTPDWVDEALPRPLRRLVPEEK